MGVAIVLRQTGVEEDHEGRELMDHVEVPGEGGPCLFSELGELSPTCCCSVDAMNDGQGKVGCTELGQWGVG